MTPSVIPDRGMVPVRESDRIASLDIIRAIALFGVMWMNFPTFSGLQALEALGRAVPGGTMDAWVKGFGAVLAQTKAASCFALLFGIGLFIQFERAEIRGVSPSLFAFRRLGSLFLIGLAHWVLIWDGDILTTYALVGCLLPFLLRARPRIFLMAALMAFVLANAWFPVSKALHFPASLDYAETERRMAPTMDALLGHGGWWQSTLWRLSTWRTLYPMSVFLPMIPWVLPSFLVGALLWSQGIVRNPDVHRHFLRRLFLLAFCLGLVVNVLTRAPLGLIPGAWKQVGFGLPWNLFRDSGRILLAVGYMSGLLLLLSHDAWKQGLAFLAPMGRMALTNYLSQSLFWTWVFYRHGLGLWGQVQPGMALLLTIGFFTLQAAWSHWWLARFKFGPAEWLWRSMTYGRWQPFRIPCETQNPESFSNGEIL